MKHKKIFKIFLAILILLIIMIIAIKIPKNDKEVIELINDGEKYIEDFKKLDDWNIYDYEKIQNRNSVASIELSEGYDDDSAVFISNDVENDVRIHRLIKVKPDSFYKVSVMVKAETGYKGNGAIISSMKTSIFYPIRTTNDEWKKYEIYIITEENQTEIDFCLGFGGYLNGSEGYVYYDNLVIEKVSEIPYNDDVIKMSFKEDLDILANISKNTKNNNKLTEVEIKIIYLIIITVVMLVLLFIYKSICQ